MSGGENSHFDGGRVYDTPPQGVQDTSNVFLGDDIENTGAGSQEDIDSYFAYYREQRDIIRAQEEAEREAEEIPMIIDSDPNDTLVP